ncbi:MAG: hypothetical protein AAGF60_10555 [Pseudomonadota bacterium]
MLRIGNLEYPDTTEGILAKSSLSKLYRAFLKTRHGEYMLNFYEAKINPERLYNQYFDPNSIDALNLTDKTNRAAQALRGKWDHKGWAQVIKAARNEIYLLLDSNFRNDFYNSKFFKAYHLKQGGTEADFNNKRTTETPDAMGSPLMKVANRLGVTNYEALRVYAINLERKGGEAMRAAGQKILSADRLRLKVETMNEVLFENGLAKRPDIVQPEPLGAEGAKVVLHKKLLILCGFENLKGAKPLERIEQMVLCMQRKDKKGAELVFGKLLKDEPKSSFLHNTTIIELMKTMKKRKAFEVLPA